MLELKNIQKEYPAGDGVVRALRGIDLQFRKNEFVSILGPSGCGKTTMLNIIGGLDQYTEGDLIINGRSTKYFKDRDWDTYRNHSIGFVFQSYNLIPHQTVLQNVELALTLSGVSKAERRERAVKALEEVGLGNQISKRPSEMSGGQMQRVAIARALVNNPDIILADEPTGALDTETSVQVMEILKVVAKDRLVIMVTHNPELAMKYSTRIIRMLDGVITDDTAPLTSEEEKTGRIQDKENQKDQALKKPSMSPSTSFALSLRNLFTKKGRTILTSFAGSIGIIGIALILAISQGLSSYISAVEEETLTSYPLTIESTTMDLSSIMSSFMGSNTGSHDHDNDAVYQNSSLYEMINAMSDLEYTENDLKSFKSYINAEYEEENSETGLCDALSGIQYSYNLELPIYTKNVDGNIVSSDLEKVMQGIMMESMGFSSSTITEMTDSTADSSFMMSMTNAALGLWQEMLPGSEGETVSDALKKQYDVVYGEWPDEYNEIVLVLDENNELDDITLYALGLIPEERINDIAKAAVNGESVEATEENWTYEEICNMDFHLVLNSDCYIYDENIEQYTDLRDTDAGLQYLYDNATALKVTGIIRPGEDTLSRMMTGSMGYTSKLTEYVIEKNEESYAVQAQLADDKTDVFTGLPFEDDVDDYSDEDKAAEVDVYFSTLTDEEKADLYVELMSTPTDAELDEMVSASMAGKERADIEQMLIPVLVSQMGVAEEEVTEYISSMSDDELNEMMETFAAEQAKAAYAQQVQGQLQNMQAAERIAGFEALAAGYTVEEKSDIYENVMTFSDSSYEENLSNLGYQDLDDPSAISLYASSFDNKEVIEDAIEAYNEDKDKLEQISYTDYVGIMMSSVTTIINAITYILIAFVAISLIVSSIMIGVITLISVQERTKEIGILRAIGASKKDVSSLFNAETVIIGFASGLLGVIVTALLCIPINAVIHDVTGIHDLNAALPLGAAVILVLISVLLTLFAGIIPSRSAARKDPVAALRSE